MAIVALTLIGGVLGTTLAQEETGSASDPSAVESDPVETPAPEGNDSPPAPPQPESEPVAGYDPTEFNPFFIQTPDGEFRLNIGAYAQVRDEVNVRSGEPDEGEPVETGWALNRTRMFFQGRYSDDFDFRLAINVDTEGDFELQQAYFTYFFGDVWELWAGKQFYNSMQEDWPDPTQLMSMENSAMVNTFALGTAFGAYLHRQPTGKTRWWLALNNGVYGSRRVFAENQESDVMLFGRLDYQVAGTDWSVWDDLIGARGQPFGILLGVSPGFLVRDSEILEESETASQVNLDVAINGDGYKVLLAGVWTGHFPKEGRSYNTYGAYCQAGYFFTGRLQGYVRYDFVSAGNRPGDFGDYSAPGIGVSFFPFNNRRWRFSGELNHLFGAIDDTIVEPAPELGWLPSDRPDQTSLRFQAQFGF